MTMFKKFSCSIVAFVLAFALGGVASAQSDTGDATVEVVPIGDGGGILSVSITNVDFGEHQYQLTHHTAYGHLTIYTSDMRGTAGGWTVTLAGDDMQSAENPDFPISIQNLLAPAGSVNHLGSPSGHPTDVPPVSHAAWPVTSAPVTVLSAAPGSGAGFYENHRTGTQLTIPGGTLIGEYQSTLTVTISGEQP